jgi:tetratricopeptide (TPR) repeat protein
MDTGGWGYLLYYLFPILLSIVMARPIVLVGVAIFFVLHPFLPDPVVWASTGRRMRGLEAQVESNPSNVTARKELAQIYLQRLRPAKAVAVLEAALALDPNDPDLSFLMGLTRFRSGEYEAALPHLVKAVELEPRLRFGDPYLVAAEALIALERFEEAEDALDRFLLANSSSVQGFVMLARVRRARGDHEGAAAAIDEALATWAQIPGYRRRKELIWYLRARLAK